MSRSIPLVSLLSVVVIVGCTAKEAAPPKEPPPPPSTEDTIHLGSVSGKLHGEPFEVKSARYYVDVRPGLEKIDVQLLAAESPSPCGDLARGPSVWLRKTGTAKMTADRATTTVTQPGEWAVHYQVLEERHWVGVGEANALLVLGEPGPDMKVRGVLWACFRDADGSCVQGEFVAERCTASIDQPVRGTSQMERPQAYLMSHDAGVKLDAGVTP